MSLIAPIPKPVTAICRDCGHGIHFKEEHQLWFHDSPAAAFWCKPADDRPASVAVEPVRCGHCGDVADVHQRRRGPLCAGCFDAAPVVVEYGTGLRAEAQADGEHIRLKVDSFNPFGSSAYMTAQDTRDLITHLEDQLKVIGVIAAEQAAAAESWPASECRQTDACLCSACYARKFGPVG